MVTHKKMVVKGFYHLSYKSDLSFTGTLKTAFKSILHLLSYFYIIYCQILQAGLRKAKIKVEITILDQLGEFGLFEAWLQNLTIDYEKLSSEG